MIPDAREIDLWLIIVILLQELQELQEFLGIEWEICVFEFINIL